jgi:hypothetical protein
MAARLPRTHVLVVIDASGSILDNGLETEIRTGFNGYLDDLVAAAKADKSLRFRITASTFNTNVYPVCVDEALAKAPRLTEATYRPLGGTALLDAVGRTIAEFEARTKLGKDDRVQLVISTDGEENSSQKHTWDQVSRMLDERALTGRWQIIYLGQGIHAWDQGSRLGAHTQIVRTRSTKMSTHATYGGLAVATVEYANNGGTDGLAHLPGQN